MSKMIIKKEEIKEDIEITIEGNAFVGINYFKNDKCFIKMDNGKLEIKLSNCTIINNEALESYKLRKEYLEEE